MKTKEMYPYTRSTWSQTLTVVQHTVFDVQASKRLFYTCYTVVRCVLSIHVIQWYSGTLERSAGPEHARAI